MVLLAVLNEMVDGMEWNGGGGRGRKRKKEGEDGVRESKIKARVFGGTVGVLRRILPPQIEGGEG